MFLPIAARVAQRIAATREDIMRRVRSLSSGLSLVEVLVGMAVLLATLQYGIPAIAGAVDSVRLDLANQAMVSSLQLARNSAVIRGQRVVLCKSPDAQHCIQDGGWEQGWIVFQDSNNNAMLDEGEVVLHREGALPGQVRMSGNRPVESYVAYTPFGHTQLTSGAFQAGTLTVCVASGEMATGRQIVISSSGRARTQMVKGETCA
jgi:type IV fimbrial biogenesis protein FimT